MLSIFKGTSKRLSGGVRQASSGKLLSSLFNCRKGNSATEFALVAPVLVVFTLGIIQVSASFYAHSTMAFAARETARKLAVGDFGSQYSADATAAQNYAQSLLSGWGSGYTVNVTIPNAGLSTTDFIVDISVPLANAAIVDPFGYLSTITLDTSSTMRME